jgi:hypothetical protein
MVMKKVIEFEVGKMYLTGAGVKAEFVSHDIVGGGVIFKIDRPHPYSEIDEEDSEDGVSVTGICGFSKGYAEGAFSELED